MKKLINNYRISLIILHDIFTIITSWFLAYYLRFNFDLPAVYSILMFKWVLFIVMIQIIFLKLFGVYRSTWRYTSINDIKRILKAIIISALIISLLTVLVNNSIRIPHSVIVLYPILLIMIMGGSRITYRIIREHQNYGYNLKKGEPVIILGSGKVTSKLLKELEQSEHWQVVCILDDDLTMHGREIEGVKVEGGIEILKKITFENNINQVIIAKSFSNNSEKRSLFDLINNLGLKALIVPGIEDLISGRLSVTQIRPVDVEDLLGRDIVKLDNSGLKKLISKKSVLVTGAGGSIGSELCRQVLKFKPSILVCLDISEYALYSLEQELKDLRLKTNIIYLVGDIKNELRLKKMFKKHKPKVVFHAAAYKHVPLMEKNNVTEALDNNVSGTFVLAKICKQLKVEKFIFVSTDKAINPTNVMGATKRLAEMVCKGLQSKTGTKFIIVRFGNVLGSSGSVIPKFRYQISTGGPITVTHPDVTRYFMSIPEAAQLVMQAALMGLGGEIFILEMGQPVRILDLAKDMIRLSGFNEDDIRIEFSGLRPGEKLYEELLTIDEETFSTSHKKLKIASSTHVDVKWVFSLIKWISSSRNKEEFKIKKELILWLKEYNPS